MSPNVTLDSAVCVLAHPGATKQRLHRDVPPLYGTPLDRALPCYSVGLFMPLCDIDAEIGPTGCERGSHMRICTAEEPEPSLDWPQMNAGDCLIMDYRLRHQGGGNSSDRLRPLVVMGYARPWYTDSVNYGIQDRLQIAPEVIDGLEDQYKGLFAKLRAVDWHDANQFKLGLDQT